jgi:hypothetical protein
MAPMSPRASKRQQKANPPFNRKANLCEGSADMQQKKQKFQLKRKCAKCSLKSLLLHGQCLLISGKK